MDTVTSTHMIQDQKWQAAGISAQCLFVPPPTAAEIDRKCELEQYRIKSQLLQQDIKGAFPNNCKSRYEIVYVLLISWGKDDPKLPAYLELDELESVFSRWYGFSTEKWVIPHEKSHNQLNRKVMEFIDLGGDSRRDLKIIYYGGHGRLTKARQPVWTNLPNPEERNYRQVVWGGIQSNLEQAQSDGLILLDCCESGVANTDNGPGTTELLAACGFDSAANPVGSNSFTHALIVKLKDLRCKAPFTVSFLFNNLLSRLSKDMPEGLGPRKKTPVHVTLTENSTLPQPIQLSPHLQDHTNTTSGSDSNNTHLPPLLEVIPQQEGDLAGISEAFLPWALDMDFLPNNSRPPIAINVWMSRQLPWSDLPVENLGDWLRMIPVNAERVEMSSGIVDIRKLLKLMQLVFTESIRRGEIPLPALRLKLLEAQEELKANCLLLDDKMEISKSSVDALNSTVFEGLAEVLREIKEQGDRIVQATKSLEHTMENLFKSLLRPGNVESVIKAGFKPVAEKVEEVLLILQNVRNSTGPIPAPRTPNLESLLNVLSTMGSTSTTNG